MPEMLEPMSQEETERERLEEKLAETNRLALRWGVPEIIRGPARQTGNEGPPSQ